MQPITEAERLVADGAMRGEATDLSALAPFQRLLRGAFVAAILWGKARLADGTPVVVHRRGVIIRHARIAGILDLNDLGAVGDPAPPVVLRHCAGEMPDDGFVLTAENAVLARLDLSHSVLACLSARGLRLAFGLDLVRARVLHGADLRDARIGSSLDARGASLAAHAGGYALWADGAAITGSVLLGAAEEHRFEARGAVSLPGATIGGVLDARGASLTAYEDGYALSADRATIAGSVVLTPADGHRFEATGEVRLVGAKIGGRLNLSGASLTAHAGGDALSADGAAITGSVVLTPADGHRFEATGAVCLISAKIGGQLAARGASLTAHAGGDALSADQAKITSGVFLTVFLTPAGGQRFKAKGAVRLHGATISGVLDARGAMLNANESGDALVADRAAITGSVFFTPADNGQRFEATGRVQLPGATISGNLFAYGASLTAHEGGHALSADRADIKGDVVLNGHGERRFEARGEVRMRGATIGGVLYLSGALLRPAEADPDRIALNLRKARIGDRLAESTLDAESTGVIDLSDAHAAMLDDIVGKWPQELGWGANDQGEPPHDPRTGALRGVHLRLHGFTYDTLVLPKGKPHTSADFWQARRAWLRRQSPDRRPTPLHFTPQPHEQLVKVLRSLGYGAEADLVARDKRDWQLACRVDLWWRRLWARFVGLAFGHYYSSLRGIATVALFIALGTVGAMAAADHGMLVAADAATAAAERACWPDFAWTSANVWVRAGALAADTFVPVLKFATSACAIRQDAPFAWAWTLGRIGYALLGLLIVPMAVLTFTGVLRRD
jgi:hypothetical protein